MSASTLARMKAAANRKRPPIPAAVIATTLPPPPPPVEEPKADPEPVAGDAAARAPTVEDQAPKKPKERPRFPTGKPAEYHDNLVGTRGRLPHGAEFHAAWDNEARKWSGRLEIPGAPVFSTESSGVFGLMHLLDTMAREWMLAQRSGERRKPSGATPHASMCPA